MKNDIKEIQRLCFWGQAGGWGVFGGRELLTLSLCLIVQQRPTSFHAYVTY